MKYYYYLILSLALFSCKVIEDEDLTEKESLKLSSTDFVNKNGETVGTATYNYSNGVISEILFDQQLINLQSSSKQVSKLEFDHDQNGQISECRYYNQNGDLVEITTFTFENDKVVMLDLQNIVSGYNQKRWFSYTLENKIDGIKYEGNYPEGNYYFLSTYQENENADSLNTVYYNTRDDLSEIYYEDLKGDNVLNNWSHGSRAEVEKTEDGIRYYVNDNDIDWQNKWCWVNLNKDYNLENSKFLIRARSLSGSTGSLQVMPHLRLLEDHPEGYSEVNSQSNNNQVMKLTTDWQVKEFDFSVYKSLTGAIGDPTKMYAIAFWSALSNVDIEIDLIAISNSNSSYAYTIGKESLKSNSIYDGNRYFNSFSLLEASEKPGNDGNIALYIKDFYPNAFGDEILNFIAGGGGINFNFSGTIYYNYEN